MKKLILAAALLAPIAAYAAVSATLSVQVVPVSPPPPPGDGGGIGCDIGPPYVGSIPAPAAAAGFTHCAANWDFTQTGSFTSGGNSYQWSDLSSWLDCAGSAHPLLWNGGLDCPGGYIITNDGGSQILDMRATPSDQQNGGLVVDSFKALGGQDTNTGRTFPQNFYDEFVFRFPNIGNAGNSFTVTDFWMYAQPQLGNQGPQNFSFQEIDIIETSNDGSCGVAGQHEWSGSYIGSYPCPAVDYTTQYATFGWRNTVDSSGNIGNCLYGNGTGHCNGESGFACNTDGSCGGDAPSQYTRLRAIIWSGTTHSVGSGNVDNFIKRRTIWTCDDWFDPSNTAIQNDWNTSHHDCFRSPMTSP